MTEYRILRKNPLQESPKEFLAWLGSLKGQPGVKFIIRPTGHVLQLDAEPPAEFIGTELEIIK